MAASKFTAENRKALLDSFEAGCSIPDASAAVGIREKTIKGWLTRGRRERSGEYVDFVEAVETARQAAASVDDLMSGNEFRLEVSNAAKRGNTAAMRLYWDILEADRKREAEAVRPMPDPLREVDDLARRRQARIRRGKNDK